MSAFTATVTIVGRREIWLSNKGRVYAKFKYSKTMADFLRGVVGVGKVKHVY